MNREYHIHQKLFSRNSPVQSRHDVFFRTTGNFSIVQTGNCDVLVFFYKFIR